VTACKVTGPMVFEETNSGHYVEIILRLIPETSILLRIGGKFLKEIVNVYRDRSFIVC
jgi:tRNA(His) 5'-end guanylyltransferase